MADKYLTLKQLENLYWRLTTQILGCDPANTAHAKVVRIAWPTEGSPAWKRDEDVVFVRISESDDDYNRQRDTVYEVKDTDNAWQRTAQTRVLQVTWICYGPNSFDKAFAIRSALYTPQYRETLAGNGIYPVPAFEAPRRAPELFAGQWWERTDLTARFNAHIRIDTTIPYLRSADITVKNSPVSGAIIQTDASVDENTKPHGGV